MKHTWILGINSTTTTKINFFWLLVKQCVATRGQKTLLKLLTDKKTEKLDWKREKTVRGKERSVMESVVTVMRVWFQNTYKHCSFQIKIFDLCYWNIFNEIQKCTSGQIKFQISNFFTQQSMVRTAQNSTAWSKKVSLWNSFYNELIGF